MLRAMWFWLLVPEAYAHRPGISYARVDSGEVSLTFAQPELARLAPLDDLDAARTLIVDRTLAKATITAGGEPCHVGEATLAVVAADGIEVRAPLSCKAADDWTFDAGYLSALEAGHRQYLEAFGQPVAVLDSASPTAAFTGTPDRVDVALQFGKLGVEHFWTGYDHLAFLVALVLVAKDLKTMLFVATGFTIAHSITLSLAATGVLTLPSALVEAAIAATIVFVGLENLWRPPAKRRIAITFALGLVHGFGFAGVLAELGLPSNALALALVSFNLGVEIGQAVVVAAVFPLLLRLRKLPWWEERAVPVASLIVAALGVMWFVQRVL
jgi:hydrogenase/urease accessory protein HupE